jgi:hypothetical protein
MPLMEREETREGYGIRSRPRAPEVRRGAAHYTIVYLTPTFSIQIGVGEVILLAAAIIQHRQQLGFHKFQRSSPHRCKVSCPILAYHRFVNRCLHLV